MGINNMGNAGFPKTRRLLCSAQFERVFAQPMKSGARGLTVLARLNDRPYPRLGLVISKRSARAAVDRNRLKRLAREAFRHVQNHLGGVDFIILSRPGLTERDNSTLTGLFSQYLLNAANQCRSS